MLFDRQSASKSSSRFFFSTSLVLHPTSQSHGSSPRPRSTYGCVKRGCTAESAKKSQQRCRGDSPSTFAVPEMGRKGGWLQNSRRLQRRGSPTSATQTRKCKLPVTQQGQLGPGIEQAANRRPGDSSARQPRTTSQQRRPDASSCRAYTCLRGWLCHAAGACRCLRSARRPGFCHPSVRNSLSAAVANRRMPIPSSL